MRGDRQKTSYFTCGRAGPHVGRAGHMSKACWLKETKKPCGRNSHAPSNKGKKGKGKGTGKGKISVNELTIPVEASLTKSTVSVSQISRVTQDTDTRDRSISMDEDEDGEYETGYILAAVDHRERFYRYEDWSAVHVLVDNSADEHLCSARDVEWIEIKPSRDPRLHGEEPVPMHLRDGRKIWIFHVCEIKGPIMSVRKICTKGNDRFASFTTRGGTLWHEAARGAEVDRVRNNYDLECWIKRRNVLALVYSGASSGSASELRHTPRRCQNE